MQFSIIIPSFDQEKFIRSTLDNVVGLKMLAESKGIRVELLLIDNESKPSVNKIIEEFRPLLDYIDISKDKGQYDAINKGVAACKGDYWTWLNTDDHIDHQGFFKLVEILKLNPKIDYIYGDIQYMDENDKLLQYIKAKDFSLVSLVNKVPGIYQPGSFFKKKFTDSIGPVHSYRCCFDYEYILRCLKNKAEIYCCDFSLARFRYYKDSKTGSLMPVFIREQLSISADYGRKTFSYLSWFSHLRLLKHKLFPR